jgi:hypothetical protein
VDGEESAGERLSGRAIEPAELAELKGHQRPFRADAPNASDDGPPCVDDRLWNERPERFPDLHLHLRLHLLTMTAIVVTPTNVGARKPPVG